MERFVDPNLARALKKHNRIFAESLLPSGGLVAIPWLNQPNPLCSGEHGACSFIGAGPSTTKADFVRAVAAGMCYELARVFAEAKKRKAFDSVVLSGGASKGVHFRKLVTALFESVPVYRVVEEDWMGARGCLYTFGSRVARAKAKRLRTPRSLDADALHRGQDAYGKAFSLLYSDTRPGEAFTFGANRGTR